MTTFAAAALPVFSQLMVYVIASPAFTVADAVLESSRMGAWIVVCTESLPVTGSLRILCPIIWTVLVSTVPSAVEHGTWYENAVSMVFPRTTLPRVTS